MAAAEHARRGYVFQAEEHDHGLVYAAPTRDVCRDEVREPRVIDGDVQYADRRLEQHGLGRGHTVCTLTPTAEIAWTSSSGS